MITDEEILSLCHLAQGDAVRLVRGAIAHNREKVLREFTPMLTIREHGRLQSWHSGEVLAAVASERDELRRRVDNQCFLANEMWLEQLRKREYDKGYAKGLQIGKMSL